MTDLSRNLQPGETFSWYGVQFDHELEADSGVNVWRAKNGDMLRHYPGESQWWAVSGDPEEPEKYLGLGASPLAALQAVEENKKTLCDDGRITDQRRPMSALQQRVNREHWDKEWRDLDDNETPRTDALKPSETPANYEQFRVLVSSGQYMPIQQGSSERRFHDTGPSYCWPIDNLLPLIKITSGDGSALGQALLSAGVTVGEIVEFDSFEELKSATTVIE